MGKIVRVSHLIPISQAVKDSATNTTRLPTQQRMTGSRPTGGSGSGSEGLVSLGGPLFRRPGTSREEFSIAWHRHAQVVAPWLLEFGVVEYVQIHLPGPTAETEEEAREGPTATTTTTTPPPSPSPPPPHPPPPPPTTATATATTTAASRNDGSTAAAATAAAAAERVLRRADGVALVRCRRVPSVDGGVRALGDGPTHPYLERVVVAAADERRFLHEECGVGGAVRREEPPTSTPGVPDLGPGAADEWRRIALWMGGVEHVKIRDARDLVEGAWWDEWEGVELGISS